MTPWFSLIPDLSSTIVWDVLKVPGVLIWSFMHQQLYWDYRFKMHLKVQCRSHSSKKTQVKKQPPIGFYRNKLQWRRFVLFLGKKHRQNSHPVFGNCQCLNFCCSLSFLLQIINIWLGPKWELLLHSEDWIRNHSCSEVLITNTGAKF